MAERKNVNKYFPVDWDPSKGSVNKAQGQHHLRERANKLSEGILVIRFEMPFNIWCEGCQSHIGMGVRYNAEKSKIGSYLSTPIHQFKMKCHLCPNYIVMRTDPQNMTYSVIKGARRKEQRWQPEEHVQIATLSSAEKKKLEQDAMFQLEHKLEDKNKLKSAANTIEKLYERNELLHRQTYDLNKQLRKNLRQEKADPHSSENLRRKFNLSVDVVPESASDVKYSKVVKFKQKDSKKSKQGGLLDKVGRKSSFGDIF